MNGPNGDTCRGGREYGEDPLSDSDKDSNGDSHSDSDCNDNG